MIGGGDRAGVALFKGPSPEDCSTSSPESSSARGNVTNSARTKS